MKALRIAALAMVVLFAAVGSAPALAARGGGGSHGGGGGWHGHGGGWHGHGGWHGSVGVYFGGWYPYYGYPYYAGYPYYGYPYYYPPAAYYPPSYAASAYPPAYVERGAAQPEANWWYYCADTKGYYPYVQECASGWSRVSPQPPSN